MSYNTALVEKMVAICPAATRETNDKLYPKVVAGDADARREMIEGNMSLVIDKVDSYLGCYPHAAYLRDDLISEGFVGLTSAVNKMAQSGLKENANATGYMSYKIGYFIGEVMDKELANGATDRTVRNRRKSGKNMPESEPLTEAAVNQVIVDPMAIVDLRDLIESCCETEIERDIIRLRERGNQEASSTPSEHASMVDKDIAKALDLPHTTVYMMRRAIYARFLEKSGMKGEV